MSIWLCYDSPAGSVLFASPDLTCSSGNSVFVALTIASIVVAFFYIGGINVALLWFSAHIKEIKRVLSADYREGFENW